MSRQELRDNVPDPFFLLGSPEIPFATRLLRRFPEPSNTAKRRAVSPAAFPPCSPSLIRPLAVLATAPVSFPPPSMSPPSLELDSPEAEHARLRTQQPPRKQTPPPKPLAVHPSLVPLEPVAPAAAKLPADGITSHPATNGLRGWMRRTFSYP